MLFPFSLLVEYIWLTQEIGMWRILNLPAKTTDISSTPHRMPHGFRLVPLLIRVPEESPSQMTGRLSNQSSPTNLAALPTNSAFESNGRRKSGISMPPPDPVAGVVDKSVIDACIKCISAAIQSTKAFHGVHGRPIVTNIFCTATA